MRTLPLILVALAGSACRTLPPPPSGDGWRVKIVRAPPAATCAELGPLTIETEKELDAFVQPGTVVLRTDRAEAHLRDLAAGLGADTLLVNAPSLAKARGEDDTDSLVLSGLAYRCDDGPPLADGRPVPQDAVLATVSRWTVVRSGPDPAAAVRSHLAPGARVLAQQAGRAGYRRVRAEDGTSLGFVEEGALQPVR